MIPVNLKFKGLHSYKEEANIVFDRLIEAQLFGIFGPTGSGKSTILEAITLALFGESERLNNNERSYLVNLSSPEMVIEFEFKQHDKLYLFEIKFARDKKDPDSAPKLKYHRGSAWDGKDWQVVTDKTSQVPDVAAEILGISADNFRRTTIIPQGKFQEFLSLKGRDRAQMMLELFKLDQFSLSGKVKKLSDATNTELALVEGNLAGLGEMSAEALEGLKQQHIVGKERIQSLAQTLEKQQVVLNEVEQLARIHQQIEQTSGIVKTLSAEYPSREQKMQEAVRYERASQDLNPIFDTLKDVKSKTNTARTARENLTRQQQAILQDLAHAEAQLAQLQADYDNRQQLTDRALAINKAVDWHNGQFNIKQLKDKHFKYQTAADEIKQQIIDQEASIKNQQKLVKNLQEAVAQEAELNKLASWYNLLDRLNATMANQQKAWNDNDALFAKTTQAINKLMADPLVKALEMDVNKPDFDKATQKLQADIQFQSGIKEGLLQRNALAALAHTLHEGEPCPLCGSVEHPNPLLEDLTSQKIKELEQLIKSLTKQQGDLAKLRSEYDRLDSTRTSQVANYKTIKASLETAAAELDTHQKGFVWQGYKADDRTAFTVAMAQLKQDKHDLNAAEISLASMAAELELLRGRLDKSGAFITDALQKLGEAEGQAKTLELQIDAAIIPDWKEANPTQLKQDAHNLVAKRDQLETTYTKLANDKVRLEKEQVGNQTNLEANQQQLNQLAHDQTRIEQNLATALAKHGFNSEAEAHELLGKFYNFEHISAEFDEFKQKLNAAKSQLELLQKQAAGKTYDSDAHSELLLQVEGLKNETEQLRSELGALEQKVKEGERTLSLRAKLLDRKADLTTRQMNLKTLESLFKGDKFINYVSSFYLRTVVEQANRRFVRLTRGQLKLVINEQTEFFVEDHLNGGRLRSIKTLSGGQLFQAALCLALSMSEAISLGQKNKFFFLDEGFGTQDSESLNDIVSTLYELRQEGRVVGIISHVDELKQLLDVSLLISNDPVRGSLVKMT